MQASVTARLTIELHALPACMLTCCSFLADSISQKHVAECPWPFVHMVQDVSKQPSNISCHRRECVLRLACLASLYCQPLYEVVGNDSPYYAFHW